MDDPDPQETPYSEDLRRGLSMDQEDLDREYRNRQIWMQNELIIRSEARAAGRRTEAAAQDSHFIASVVMGVAALLWIVAVVALYDVVVAQLVLLEPVVERVPDSWLRPGWLGTVLRAGLAVLIALPLFVMAFVLKKVRIAVGRRFPHAWWTAILLWTWMMLLTTVRAVIDLLGIAVAWVSFQLLREAEVGPVTDMGTGALSVALLFIVPAAGVRAFVLTRQARHTRYL